MKPTITAALAIIERGSSWPVPLTIIIAASGTTTRAATRSHKLLPIQPRPSRARWGAGIRKPSGTSRTATSASAVRRKTEATSMPETRYS
jgi:hypothetical protein